MSGGKLSLNLLVAVCLAAVILGLTLLRESPRTSIADLSEQPTRQVLPSLELAAVDDNRTASPLPSPVQPVSADARENPEPTVEAADDLTGIASEKDPMRVRWRVLRYELQDYRKLKSKTAAGSREGTLVCDSVGAILEMSGRGLDPDWNRSSSASEYYMINNGRGYLVAVGEFPEYDAWRVFMFAMGDHNAARAKGLGPGAQASGFDPANFELIEARAQEAISMLESRFGFSPGSK